MKTATLKAAMVGIGVIYGALALYLVVQQQWLDAAMWLLIGAGLALSSTSTPEQWHARPRWLRGTAVAAIAAGLLLFVVRIALDWRS